MTERPILFTGPMVRGVLAGVKRQTRRLVKPQPSLAFQSGWDGARYVWTSLSQDATAAGHAGMFEGRVCPHGAPGDRLWVRETWCGPTPTELAKPRGRVPTLAVWGHHATDSYENGGDCGPGTRWRPSIHMPRVACRLTLAVESVRVERVQAISDADIAAEGVTAEAVESLWKGATGQNKQDAREMYRSDEINLPEEITSLDPPDHWRIAWTLINGAESWRSDPWVWVVGFRRLEQEARAA